jgi:hypothetical protein
MSLFALGIITLVGIFLACNAQQLTSVSEALRGHDIGE